MVDDRNRPEQPRAEPEIIPPTVGRESGRQPGWPPYGFTRSRATHRVFVTRIGPLGAALLLLGVAFMAAVLLLTLLGAVLIWLPIVILIAVIAAFAGLLRRL